MTNKMFDYMSRVMAVSDHAMHFPVQKVSAVSDLPLLQEAKDRGWLVVRADDCHVTPAGVQAFRSEKELRDQEADKRRQQSSNQALRVLTKIAFVILSAFATAFAAQLVSLLFQ